MGNSNSTSNRLSSSQNANSSASFGQNSPRASPLRTKKKSLELPDLASLTFTTTDHASNRIHTPPKSASIPIPVQSPAVHQYRNENRPVNNLSAVDDDDLVTEQPSTHIPFPPNRGRQTGPPSYFRGNTARFQQQQQQQQQRVQELYNQSNVPVPPPSSPNPSLSRRRSSFVQEIVTSSIPSGLRSLDDASGSCATPTLVSVKITWTGGGNNVVLVRAGDDDWKGRKVMDRESATSTNYTTTVALPPGTHHIRFIVDDKSRVAEDLPTAVDDQGSMANYVAVPISYSPPRSSARANRVIPGQSFWSASSADGDDSSPSRSHSHHGHAHHSSKSQSGTYKSTAVWTAELPLELIEAAKEEEAYLAASAGHNYDSEPPRGGGGRESHRGERGATHINGFVPAPNIPPAPSLPRHLDKLILNTRVAAAPPPGVGSGGTNSALVASGGAVGALGNGLTAGTGIGGASGRGSKREGRDKGGRRDRERDATKEREGRRGAPGSGHGHPPPAPPPSEVGDTPDELEASMSSIVDTPATTTPEGPMTPPEDVVQFIPLSGGNGHALTAAAEGVEKEKEKERDIALKLLDSELPALTDDAAVLPVPSHVVLHHLSTSAIRHGVLAVANTTRYRKKYLTTVYYKPT